MVARCGPPPPRRYEALAYIIDFIRKFGFPPTYEEIGAHMGVGASRAKQYGSQLIAEEILGKRYGGQRCLVVRDLTRAQAAILGALQHTGAMVAPPLGSLSPYPERQLPRLPPFTYLAEG